MTKPLPVSANWWRAGPRASRSPISPVTVSLWRSTSTWTGASSSPELLLEYTVNKLRDKGWTEEEFPLVDVGTGSGVIAVYLALRFPRAKVYATDISTEALEVAKLNARRFEVEERINFLQGNLLEPLPEPVKILVSNPPYTILAQVEPNVARYEPNIALDGGPKGLAIYRELLRQAQTRLVRPGLIALEIGSEQANDVANLGRFFFPGCQIDVFKDYAGLDRVVILDIGEEPHNLP